MVEKEKDVTHIVCEEFNLEIQLSEQSLRLLKEQIKVLEFKLYLTKKKGDILNTLEKPRSDWTEVEDNMLRKTYPNMSAYQIRQSGLTLRSETAIHDRAKILGITKSIKQRGEKENKKLCSHCKKIKPLSEFNKSKSGRLGVQNTCKVDQKELLRNWRLSKKKKLAEKIFAEGNIKTEIGNPKDGMTHTTKAPDNTILFLNWIIKKGFKQNAIFNVEDFVKDNSEIMNMEKALQIMGHQITLNRLRQMSNTRFRILI